MAFVSLISENYCYATIAAAAAADFAVKYYCWLFINNFLYV